jgi:hypothetical protein
MFRQTIGLLNTHAVYKVDFSTSKVTGSLKDHDGIGGTGDRARLAGQWRKPELNRILGGVDTHQI